MDYEALARQLGGEQVSEIPPSAVDYGSLARQLGGELEPATAEIPGAAPGQVAPPAEPETPSMTMPGMAGAVTRGLAPTVAGATAGGMIAGLPGAAAGGAAGFLAPVVADPLVAQFNKFFGTNYQAPSQALQDLLTRFGVAVPRSEGEIKTQQAASGVGAGVALPAAAGRTAAAMAAGTRAEPYVAPVAEAVRVSGMGATGGRTVGERTGAGMIAGGIAAAPGAEAPIDVATGMLGGGVVSGFVPPLVQVGGQAIRGLWETTVEPIRAPAAVAARQLYRAVGGTPETAEAAAQATRAGMQVPTTPGFQRTLPETMVAGGAEPPSTLAVLADRVRSATPDQLRDLDRLMNERSGALQAQLARINQQIDQQGAMLQPGALDELTQARDSILRNLETERAVYEAAMQQSAARLPATPQAIGGDISRRAAELDRLFKETEVNPRYNEALRLGGDAPNIDASEIEQVVEGIYGRPLSTFKPGSQPRIVGILNRLAQQRGADEPPMTTLAILHDLRKAVNKESSSAVRAGNNDLAYNLQQLQSSIDNAITTAPGLSDDAKNAYAEATRFYRDTYAPKFRAGKTGRILRPAAYDEMVITPDKVVSEFLSGRTPAQQFVRTFAGDAQAYDSMRNGILGQFRLAAVDPQTGLVNPARAAKFLQDNAEPLAVFENAGLGVRNAMQRLEQEAVQGNQALDAVAKSVTAWRDKTPAQVLDHILGSGDRMGVALARSDAAGKDAIRRVVQTRLNTMLTQTPGGKPLSEADALRVVNELTDATGNLKDAYAKALGPNLAQQFADRARGLREVIKYQSDPLVDNPNAIASTLRSQNFTAAQLTDIKTVADDIRRAQQVAAAAQRARAATRPTGRDILGEEAEEGTLRPDRLNLLNRAYTLFRNVYMGVRDRLNPKISAQLANMIYKNPDAAITALEAEIARAQRGRVRMPAGPAAGVAPAAYGAGYSTLMQKAIENEALRPTQE